MNDREFAEKVEWEGGALEALLEYGLSYRDLDDPKTDLFRLLVQFDEIRPAVSRLISDIEEALEAVSDGGD